MRGTTRAPPKTEIVQEGQYQPGAPVDRVIVDPTPETVAKEVTAKGEEDHRIEAEEV